MGQKFNAIIEYLMQKLALIFAPEHVIFKQYLSNI
jgi:hypothetical protein